MNVEPVPVQNNQFFSPIPRDICHVETVHAFLESPQERFCDRVEDGHVTLFVTFLRCTQLLGLSKWDLRLCVRDNHDFHNQTDGDNKQHM